jgi:hypothetical protein
MCLGWLIPKLSFTDRDCECDCVIYDRDCDRDLGNLKSLFETDNPLVLYWSASFKEEKSEDWKRQKPLTCVKMMTKNVFIGKEKSDD